MHNARSINSPTLSKSMVSKARARIWFINGGMLLLSFVAMFTIGEFVVRAVYGDSVSLFPRYHTSAEYGDFQLRRIRPNSTFYHKSKDGQWKYQTNNKGFRNFEDVEYAKPKGVVRVLSLGDSHTQGYEVRQNYTFSAVVEKYLSRQNISAQVLNAGVSGFSTAEELVFLENEGIKYDPDVVILGFYRNDIEDNIRTGLFELSESGELVVSSKQYTPGVRIQDAIYSVPGVKWLGENSYFYSVLFNATWQYMRSRRTQSRTDETIEYAVATQTDHSEYQTSLSIELVKRMSEYCKDNGIKFIIVDIPSYNDEGGIQSSLPVSLRDTVAIHSDYFVDTLEILSDYVGVVEIHRPNGQRHISELTHTMIGIDAAKFITLALNTTQSL